jgi:hypothetical protein
MIRNRFLAAFQQSRTQGRCPRHHSARRRAFVLCPEALEDRTVLSPFMVTNNLDSGPGSLRQAVLDANQAGGSNTISFASSVNNIALTSGELAINDDLTISGPGSGALSVSGSNTSRVFDVESGMTATIEGLTLTNGFAGGAAPGYPSSGGGILNQGSLTLNDVVLNANQAVGDPSVVIPASLIFNTLGGALGGGIANFGTLAVTDCTFTNNQALGASNANGSSLLFPSFPGDALGGGLSNYGSVSIESSEFSGNLAQAGSGGIGPFAAIGGGGAIHNDNSLSVDGTSIHDNQAIGGSNSTSGNHNGHALGGGIMSGTLLALLGAGSASLAVSNSTFAHNQALGGNDNVVTDAFVPRSDAPDNAYGGAILVYQGSAAVSNTTVTKNQAIGGTGFGVSGEWSLGVGGWIFFYNFVGGVTASVDGSTISKNDAIGGDGEAGINGGEGLGGGIAIGGLGSPFTGPGSVTISNTTITNNLAQGGQGWRRGRRG